MYKRIRELREDHDLKQRELAEILQCSQRVYSNYERGDIDIPTEILIRLADYYQVSTDYILDRTDNPAMNSK
ncbi:MAG: helix-turn-helix transcriptional regulator [Eubacterium sp.]|nr:helix-turn-helix transcriptional regulator [Eubacterium sp.]